MDVLAAAKKIVTRAGDLIAALRLGRDRLLARREGKGRLAGSSAAKSPSIHDLVPLDTAATVIFRRVYLEQTPLGTLGRLPAHLDGLAYTIAELVPIYVFEPSGGVVRELAREEIAGGLFQGGAKEISFIDGRERIGNLALNAKDIDAVIQTLVESTKAD